jgi:curved DNA-binding protein CbpA
MNIEILILKGDLSSMTNYFVDCTTIDQVKEVYRQLAKKYHPDINSSGEEEMKNINSQYDEIINNLKDTTSNKKTESQVYEAEMFKNIISKIIHIEDIEIEICNWFLWISGNTKEHKEIFKQLGFKWASKKKQWYYKPDWYFSRNRNEWDMNTIRNKYGSIKIDKNKKSSKKYERLN